MSRPKPSGRSYGRLTRHERNTVERMLDRNRSAREIAAELGRSPSTVTREVAAHRYVTAPRSRYGEPAPADLSGACPRLSAWPRGRWRDRRRAGTWAGGPVALSPERLRGGLAEHAAAAWGHRTPQPLHLRKRSDGQVPGAISALR